MDNNEFEIYDGKSFKDLCKEIFERSENKKNQLDVLISDLRSLIKEVNDVIIFMPKIKELLEVGVKNDDQLVKLSSVIQRMKCSQGDTSSDDSVGLTEEEKQQLLDARAKEIESMEKIKHEVDSPIDNLKC